MMDVWSTDVAASLNQKIYIYLGVTGYYYSSIPVMHNRATDKYQG